MTIRFAFVFPGQGSQSVGMLNAFADNPTVTDTLAEASDVLKQDLQRLVTHGSAEDLNLTTNTQPVMLAAGVAFYRAWKAAGGATPGVVAGHSLGEYAALVAADVIDFADALPLVRYRADAMQKAVPVGVGGMAAILGLDDDVVRAACAQAAEGQVVEAVNFNAPSQVVIAGDKAAVERACVVAKTLGAKRAVPLPVSAPFHSSLMRPAADQLGSYLGGVSFKTPLVKVINNVDVAILTGTAAIKDALVRQAWRPVRWAETIRAMPGLGITHVIECGPGKVLSGLTRRINGDLISGVISDPESLAGLLEDLK